MILHAFSCNINFYDSSLRLSRVLYNDSRTSFKNKYIIMTTNVRSWYISRDIIYQRERTRFWTRFPWVSRMSRLECLHWKQG